MYADGAKEGDGKALVAQRLVVAQLVVALFLIGRRSPLSLLRTPSRISTPTRCENLQDAAGTGRRVAGRDGRT